MNRGVRLVNRRAFAYCRLLIITFLCFGFVSTCRSEDGASVEPQVPTATESEIRTYVVKIRTLEAIRKSFNIEQRQQLPLVAAAVNEDEKLSLPLLVALSSQGVLYGHTKSGEWLIRGAPSCRNRLVKSGLVEGIKAGQPKEFNPVRDMVLIVDPETKPSAESFGKFRVDVLEHHQRKLYGYMQVRYRGKEDGIPSSLAKAIRDNNGVIKADVITTVTIEQAPPPKPGDVHHRPSQQLGIRVVIGRPEQYCETASSVALRPHASRREEESPPG